jgi:hypothetical protein
MKTEKIKRYRLGISRTFPKTHQRAGQPTYFVEKIEMMLQGFDGLENTKIHTIRKNYPLWEKRMREVQAGRAVIELFYWSGKPYNSPQIVFATLDMYSGCGVQMLILNPKSVLQDSIELFAIDDKFHNPVNLGWLSKNDGLTYEDFKEWFKGYDLNQPMAIIHFTKFRY